MFKNVPMPAPEGQALGRTHLCPRCGDELEKQKYECPTCHLVFKNKKKARQISLIFPGGGYFYTGHFLLGALDAFVETYLTILVIISVVMLFQGQEGAAMTLVLFLLVLSMEKAITIYEANNFIDEFIPLKKQTGPHHEEQAAALV
jgi:uncharacterized C2H2 Zn-finger protein